MPQMAPTAAVVRLEPMPYPVYFVHPHRNKWSDIFDANEPPDPDQIYWRFIESSDVWVVSTYLHLRRRGLDVRLVSQVVPNAINVIMNYDLGVRKFSYNCYVVSCRADTFRPTLCQHAIVQNPHNLLSRTDHLIQHWPQPGLIERDNSRGSNIQSIFFIGHSVNLWSAFRDPSFQHRLQEIGVTFRTGEDASKWNDYRECDLALAVRDATATDFFAKPASKLINAWHAKVPALLGPEPAFQALRTTPLDYIEVRSPEDVIRAVIRLKEEPELYRKMVENGILRGQEFTTDRIAARWREILAGPVANGFSAWAGRSQIWKSLMRPALFAVQAARTVHEKRSYVNQRDHGFRPISGRFT
jgi:hypothetical protein